MKCQSCNAEIPPEWVNAIKNNICPGCGNAIMQEEVVTLMAELADAISKMEFNAQEITGWLLSNYRLEKVGDGQPTGFHRPRRVVASDGNEYSEDKIEKLNDFFKRADAPMGVVGRKRKDLLKQRDEIIEDDDDFDDDDDDEQEEEEEVVVVKKKAKKRGTGIDPALADVNTTDFLSEDEIEEIQRKAEAERKLRKRIPAPMPVPFEGKMPEEYPLLADDESMTPALRAHTEAQMQRIEQARENVTSGIRMNKNAFSRG